MTSHAYSEDQLVEQPAIGLFAAIPAVIAYNRFSHRVNQFEARLQRFATRLHANLTRQLEAG